MLTYRIKIGTYQSEAFEAENDEAAVAKAQCLKPLANIETLQVIRNFAWEWVV